MTVIKTISLGTTVVMGVRMQCESLLRMLSCEPKSYSDLVALQHTMETFANRCDALQDDIEQGKKALQGEKNVI